MEEIINQFDENGNKHGKWITGKRFKKVEHYVNGIRHGEIYHYITEGKPRYVGNYNNGKRAGVWHWYYYNNKNIEVRQSYDYSNGLVHNEKFRESGILIEKGFERKTDNELISTKVDLWQFYDEDGILESEMIFIV